MKDAMGRTFGPSAYLLMLLMSSTLVFTSHTTTNGEYQRVDIQEAVNISKRFMCRDPQPRAYNIKDIMKSLSKNPSESVNQPFFLVIKRCDGHSGCCMGFGKSCTPLASAIYYEDIQIEYWSHLTNVSRKEWIRVEQHGKCTCEVTSSSDRLIIDNRRPNVTLLGS